MKVDARRKEARSTGKVPFFTSYVKLKLKLVMMASSRGTRFVDKMTKVPFLEN